MQVLNTQQTQSVAGGSIVVYPFIWFYEQLITAALTDLWNGNLEHLGEIENRPTGTRP